MLLPSVKIYNTLTKCISCINMIIIWKKLMKTDSSPLGRSKSKRSVRIPYCDSVSCFFIQFGSSVFFISWKSAITVLRYANFKCWEIVSFSSGEDISCDRPQVPINNAVTCLRLSFLIAVCYYIIWKNIFIV